MRRVSCLILVFFMIGCLQACDTLYSPSLEEAKDAVRERLKDPESAKFRNIEKGYWRSTQTYIVRGEFDGKNSLGGYNGYTKFVYDCKIKLLMIGDDYTKLIDMYFDGNLR
ncbi:hypothetical protein [Desulfovibrio sp. Fe33]|uniref:hypothetical protein n=1 Tax=Desulfovibrio sp. Fe33 TaxID=3020842 RepID=UPI00234CF30F|nr:hypothetical protein [Desulfovibrio sp. Fe33]